MQVMQHKWVQQGPHWQGSLATSTFSVAGMPFIACSRLLAVAFQDCDLLPLNSCLLQSKGVLSLLASLLYQCWCKEISGGGEPEGGACQDKELHPRFHFINNTFFTGNVL